MLLLTAIISQSLYADFFSPFADSKVNTTLSSEGEIVAVKNKGGGTDYFIRVPVCGAGLSDIPAEIPENLVVSGMAGKTATITATIREKADADKKNMIRYLEVTKIVIS